MKACRPGRAYTSDAGQTLRNLCDRTQRCPRMRARSAGLFESARSRTRENSSAELTRRGWLSARRAGVQTTISGATGREADDKAARGAPKHVGGQEAIPPVRCARPSPVLRPRSRISRCFCSFDPLRACLCEPLPLRARASDGARAGKKVAPNPELHAGAARAASRPRERRRGRLERRRLAALPRRPTDGRPPREGCSCGPPLRLSRVAGLLRERHERRATRRRAAGRGGRRRRRRRPRRERRWRHCVGTLRAERGAPQRRACGDGAPHGRRRAARARPGRAHRAGRAALARVAEPLRGCRTRRRMC